MVVDKLRTAYITHAFPELRDPHIKELRLAAARATTIAALFEDESKMLAHEGLVLAHPNYTAALVTAWEETKSDLIGPGFVADFAIAERLLRTDAYKSLSSRWGNFVLRSYQEESHAQDWEIGSAPTIWSDSVQNLAPEITLLPEFEEAAEAPHAEELTEVQNTIEIRDAKIAKITLRELTMRGLHREQRAIYHGSMVAGLVA
ncbi:MAG TPA: hypothetical protein VFN56_00500 [Candidatus Saccharimonadales bacterium]|nr:hypothetical protein [Candidatus Saccharimonadales bacterium]